MSCKKPDDLRYLHLHTQHGCAILIPQSLSYFLRVLPSQSVGASYISRDLVRPRISSYELLVGETLSRPVTDHTCRSLIRQIYEARRRGTKRGMPDQQFMRSRKCGRG